MEKVKDQLRKITCWNNGTFYYDKISLRQILDEIEKRFNTRIICQPAGIGDQMYSGYLINTHLDSALMSVCWPLRISYQHQGNNILVTR